MHAVLWTFFLIGSLSAKGNQTLSNDWQRLAGEVILGKSVREEMQVFDKVAGFNHSFG
jgi:hypothetical protein